REPGGAVSIVEFLCAFAGRPLRFETRQQTANLVAIDAVAALIRASAGCILNAAPRNSFLNDGRQFADAVVFPGLSNIEDFILDNVPGSVQHTYHSRNDVTNVHDR